MAYTTYATGTEEVVTKLVEQSGNRGVFVSRLARDRQQGRSSVHWVERTRGLSDLDYLTEIQKPAEKDGKGPIIHRAGGGSDLGCETKSAKAEQSPPFVFRVAAPPWWSEQDTEKFMTDSAWQGVKVLAQLDRGVFRIRTTERPTEQTTYYYDLNGGAYVKVTPQVRRTSSTPVGRFLNRPQLPWLAEKEEDPTALDVDMKKEEEQKEDEKAGEGGLAGEEGKGGQPRPGAPQPSAKKQKTDHAQDAISDKKSPIYGFQAVETGGGGLCGYCSVAGAMRLTNDKALEMTEANLKNIKADAGTLRVKTVQAMKKYSDKWKPMFAADPDFPEHTGNNWDEYMANCQKPEFGAGELRCGPSRTASGRQSRSSTRMRRTDGGGAPWSPAS